MTAIAKLLLALVELLAEWLRRARRIDLESKNEEIQRDPAGSFLRHFGAGVPRASDVPGNAPGVDERNRDRGGGDLH